MRAPSTLANYHGNGLFSLRTFTKGEVVCTYSGQQKWLSDVKQLPCHLTRYVVVPTVASSWVIDSALETKTSMGHLINANFSLSNVNVCLRWNDVKRIMEVIATKDIPPDTELFLRYGVYYMHYLKQLQKNQELRLPHIYYSDRTSIPISREDQPAENYFESLPDEVVMLIFGILDNISDWVRLSVTCVRFRSMLHQQLFIFKKVLELSVPKTGRRKILRSLRYILHNEGEYRTAYPASKISPVPLKRSQFVTCMTFFYKAVSLEGNLNAHPCVLHWPFGE